MSRIKQDLETLCMEDIWENGRDNYNISTRISEKGANTERQNMDGERMRCLQTQYTSLKSNRLNEACTGGAKGGVDGGKQEFADGRV